MTAVGFRVKSGYAIAVVLDGSRAAPRAVARRIVELSDPDVAETRQPYHDGFYKTEEDAREIARRVAIVKRCAKRSIAALISQMEGGASAEPRRPASAKATAVRRSFSEGGSWGETQGERRRAALVVGSLIDPDRVGNPHIRAHAHEGRLFRTVLQDALRAHRVECDVILEKQLSAHASNVLGRPPSAIARTITALGKTMAGPWRAEEKAAATAAWLALTRE